jgi:hypothetical protein
MYWGSFKPHRKRKTTMVRKRGEIRFMMLARLREDDI